MSNFSQDFSLNFSTTPGIPVHHYYLFIVYQITTTHIFFCTCRFLYCSELWGDTRETIDNMFMDYLQKAPQDQHKEVGPYTLIAHVNDMPVQSKKQQFLLLGSITNYNILPHPDSTSATEKLTNPEGHIGYFQHVLFHLEGSHNIPSSPRNRLVHYLLLEESFVPDLLVKRYLKLDNQSTGADIEVNIPDPPPPRPRKKRKQQKRIVSVSIHDINASAGKDLNALLNCANWTLLLPTVTELGAFSLCYFY